MKKAGIIEVIVRIIIFCLIVYWIGNLVGGFTDDNEEYYNNQYDDRVFYILSSSENQILDKPIKDYAKKKKYDITITYADSLEIIDKLNSGEKYDAVFISNSMWLSMLDSSKVKTSSLRSTSITPVVFGIKDSIAEKLGFKDKKIYSSDILREIKNGNLKFSMANPITTNSGASAYLEILTNLSGNPEVLKSSHLQDTKLKGELKDFFKGITRTSGDENFLETSFINGDYDAAFTYESSIININKQLQASNKETLYAIYPVDGVAISDSAFVYVDNKNDNKKEIFNEIQKYLLSDSGQRILLENGRRTWYGGINKNAPSDVFNPKWGINTKEYITPIKYPSMAVIKEAFALYQAEFRKPVHVVFCLDYSGSMSGNGISQLINAMRTILTTDDMTIKFSEKDKIDVVPFSSNVRDTWSTSNGLTLDEILEKIETASVTGSTALFPAAERAIEILSKENQDEYVTSVILMTDGEGNVGSFDSFRSEYNSINKEIPVYSITFGSASESQLNSISQLTNGKVFDGKNDLTLAFKKVRGYN